MFIEISMNTLLKNSPLWHFWDVDGQKPWYRQCSHEKQSQKKTPLSQFTSASMQKTQPLSHFWKSISKNDNPYRESIFLNMRGVGEMLFFNIPPLTPAPVYSNSGSRIIPFIHALHR